MGVGNAAPSLAGISGIPCATTAPSPIMVSPRGSDGAMNRWHRYAALQGQLRGRQARDLPPLERARSLVAIDRERTARREEAGRRRAGLWLGAGVALLAHVAVLLPLFAWWMQGASGAQPSERTRVALLGAGRSSKAPQTVSVPPAVSPPQDRAPRPRPQPEDPPPGQLVTLPQSRDEPPERADYLAQDDHRAERETRSRFQTQHYENPAHRPQSGPQPAPTASPESLPLATTGEDAAAAGSAGPGDTEGGPKAAAARPQLALPAQQGRSALELPDSPEGQHRNESQQEGIDSPHQRLAMRLGPSDAAEEDRPHGEAGPAVGWRGGGAGVAGLPSLAQLTPSLQELERYAGQPANDALNEVETDAETRLNAWRWKHATFFDRLKRGVNRHWRGIEVYQRYRPDPSVYGTRSLLTWLTVTIDRSGQVVDVDVSRASGAYFLDDEAVRTMRAAAPFVNPPSALFRGNPTFTFRFGFEIRHDSAHIDLDWRPY